MKFYHYSEVKIEKIDFDKCENGFWATSVSPDMLEEYESEIGFNGSNFCMIIEIDDDADYCLVEQDSAKEEIEENEAVFGLIRYENDQIAYEDVVFFNTSAIKNITSIKL